MTIDQKYLTFIINTSKFKYNQFNSILENLWRFYFFLHEFISL